MKRALLILIVVMVVAASVFFDLRSLLKEALHWVEQQGTWGPLIFGLLYIAAAVLLLPGSILTAGAGTLFGVVRGSIIVSLASTVAAAVSFLIGRYLARGWVESKVKGNASFAAIDEAVKQGGWLIVGLTRLSPLFPYTLLNYAYGLTQVKFWHYVLASWIAMMPGTVMYVYVGSLARTAAEKKTTTEWSLYGLGLLATVLVTVVVTKKARTALAARAELPTPVLS